MDKISMGKKYTTVDGREVKILSINGEGGYPIIGQINYGSNSWGVAAWDVHGFNPASNSLNLKEVKKRIVGWLNVYPNGGTSDIHVSKQFADKTCRESRIACIKIDVEEGTFDD